MIRTFLAVICAAYAAGGYVGSPNLSEAAEPRLPLLVSDDGHSLVREDGEPFFYLADTAWELFHRLNREDALYYLDKRAAQGFTAVQAVALAELDGLKDPNAYGHLPLVDLDPTKPAVVAGPNNDYWDHVDFIVQAANERGMVVALLPSWGDKWNKKWGEGPEIFTVENAETYAKWLGERYRDADLIWVLGGDRPIDADGHRKIIEAFAKGLKAGDGGKHLITFHPPGGNGSSDWFHNDSWLDFNFRQNGHVIEYERYLQTRIAYDLAPIKPIIDGEPAYEDHPVAFNAKQFGYTIAADVRRLIYWDLFAGACGHTYGNHCVWQMYSASKKPINGPPREWRQALDAPGASQMVHAKNLVESRPMLSRIPDDSLIVQELPFPGAPPLGSGTRRMAAARDGQGTYAFVYSPAGVPFKVRTNKLSGSALHAWWYDPRTGEASDLGEIPKKETAEFFPPAQGEAMDWVLVLDDLAKEYPPPGNRKSVR